MKNVIRSLFFFFILLTAHTLKSQSYVQMMQDKTANFYDIQRAFNEYWSTHDKTQKGKGYKAFKRWEYMVEPRVYPSGNLSVLELQPSTFSALQEEAYAMSSSRALVNASWSSLGPAGAPSGGNAGRVNFVRFSPTDTATIFVGTPNGGLWKSSNSGGSWTQLTENFPFLGCSDLAIHPTNPNIMYLATGDADASDINSFGVLRTLDGGVTWDSTGRTFGVSALRTIRRLLINPLNPNTLFMGASDGIWRSLNAGVTWTQITTNSIRDMEFKPGDTTVVYACGTSFYRSTNGGTSFSTITSGLPASSVVTRMQISVTPAKPSIVFLLAAKSSDSGFQGVYKSSDNGLNFVTRATTPNLLGWNTTGSDAGGQGWYDLALAVSPTDSNELFVGGVNVWKSTNGGTSYTQVAYWASGGTNYVHADVHDLQYNPRRSGYIYAGTDGGIFRSFNGGTVWRDYTGTMNIAQIYRMGLSASNANQLICGHQDNGTNLRSTTGTWSEVNGGDGMDCFVDYTNNARLFSAIYNGDYYRSTNTGASWTNIVSGLTGNAAWVAPWQQDPNAVNTLYCGYQDVFKSTNSGTSWTQISTLSGTSTIVDLFVAPSNSQYIYVIKGNVLYKTTNGGTSWTNITTGLPTSSASMTRVTVHPTNPNRLWVTFSGYTATAKVYESTNGGTSWVNYSTGLPNLPVNCIVVDRIGPLGFYVGTDAGVYHRDTTMTSWRAFKDGMPNVIVNDLEIYYPTKRLRAATYGRGVYESNLGNDTTSPGALPVANFSNAPTTICEGDTITFTDISTGSPTSRNWTFSGCSPNVTASTTNPVKVVFNTNGTTSVKLVIRNGFGADSITRSITVNANQIPIISVIGDSVYCVTSATSYQWYLNGSIITGATSRSYKVTTTGNYTVRVLNTTGCYRTSASSPVTARPVSSFSFSPVLVCQFDTIQFTDNSTNTPTGWTWTFPGGSPASSTARNPRVAFSTTGSRTVSLTSSNASGPHTYTQSINVLSNPKPTVDSALNLVSTTAVGTSYQWFRNGAAISGANASSYTISANGNYSVRVTNSNGCTNTSDPRPMNMLMAPSTAFNMSDDIICEGDTIRFTDNSGNAPTFWSWVINGGSPNGSADQNPVSVFNTAGTFNVTLTASNAAGSNFSSKNVTVKPNPSPDILLSGTTTLYTTFAGTSYQWYKDGVAISGSVSPSHEAVATGTYYVSVVDSNNCSGRSSNRLVELNISVKPIANGVSVSLYPNPAHDKFIIRIQNDGEAANQIRIYNAIGAQVRSLQIQEQKIQEIEFDVRNLSNGVYIVKVLRNESLLSVDRISVQK